MGFLLIGTKTKESTIRKVNIACGIAALLAILVSPVIALRFKIGFDVPELIENCARKIIFIDIEQFVFSDSAVS